MSDNELLLAISQMMDAKLDARLKPIENRLERIENLLENNVLPCLNTLERLYQKVDSMETILKKNSLT